MNAAGGVAFVLDAHVDAASEIEGIHELGLDDDRGAGRRGATGKQGHAKQGQRGVRKPRPDCARKCRAGPSRALVFQESIRYRRTRGEVQEGWTLLSALVALDRSLQQFVVGIVLGGVAPDLLGILLLATHPEHLTDVSGNFRVGSQTVGALKVG